MKKQIPNSSNTPNTLIPRKLHPFKNPHRSPTEPMGIHHSPHTHAIPIPMGIPIPTAALDICYTSRVIADFAPNFGAMSTGFGRGEFIWHHSIAWPWKPPVIRKNLRDISYISRVIADFVPNFVAMATKVSRCNIWLTPFDSPTPKTPCQTQTSRRYLLYKPSYSQFSPKFRCHGNKGWSWQNLAGYSNGSGTDKNIEDIVRYIYLVCSKCQDAVFRHVFGKCGPIFNRMISTALRKCFIFV